MKNDMLSVGLDIGTTKVVVMVGRRKEDSTVEIIGVGQSPSTGVSKGAIQNISKTISAIRQAVEMAEEASGVKINEVTVGIAGQYIRSARQTDYITRPNPERVIDQDDLDRLRVQVEKAAPHSEHEQIIHVLPQEYKVDAEGRHTGTDRYVRTAPRSYVPYSDRPGSPAFERQAVCGGSRAQTGRP